ncbi:MAG: ATP-binding cassette domain-containing protein [Saprospiraceae bacterium]
MRHKLEVTGVKMEYGLRQILTDVYLTGETGEVVGLFGRNGSGKTTLLKIIFGSLHPINHHVTIDGKYFGQPYKQGNLIAYLPQHHISPAKMTVEKIIRLYSVNQAAREDLLKNNNLKPLLKIQTRDLSYGQLRYFEILLLVHLDVKFVLFDEPFSGLDPQHKELISELIQKLKTSKGFIITDHDYRNILKVSDRFVLLKDGYCRKIAGSKELETLGYLPEGITPAI